MKSNVAECELSQHCVWRPHSIMGYLSDGINHSATVMHNAVKQNFTEKNIPTRGYLMTVVVWWGCLFIKCQSPSSLRRREMSKQQTKYDFNNEMGADADARECNELSANLWTVVSFWKQMVASARSHPDLLVTSGVTKARTHYALDHITDCMRKWSVKAKIHEGFFTQNCTKALSSLCSGKEKILLRHSAFFWKWIIPWVLRGNLPQKCSATSYSNWQVGLRATVPSRTNIQRLNLGKLSCCKSRMSHTAAACLQR